MICLVESFRSRQLTDDDGNGHDTAYISPHMLFLSSYSVLRVTISYT